MNKQDVVAKIAKDTGITKTNAAAVIDSIIHGITKALKKGDLSRLRERSCDVTSDLVTESQSAQRALIVKIFACVVSLERRYAAFFSEKRSSALSRIASVAGAGWPNSTSGSSTAIVGSRPFWWSGVPAGVR